MSEVRLIDAEALKQALHNFFDGKVIDEPTYILRDVFCYIDNAPTVERPQSEWKIIEHDNHYLMGIYQCDLCSYKYACPDEFARNYCPNCGAKMKND